MSESLEDLLDELVSEAREDAVRSEWGGSNRVDVEAARAKVEGEFEKLRADLTAARADAERLAKALQALMEFHPEDELGPTTEDCWSPEYKAAMDTAHKALAEHQRGEG